jgi:hypothetical protein
MKTFEDLKQALIDLQIELINLEHENPNNFELGQRVRDLVWSWKRNANSNPNQTKINFKEDGSKPN